MENYRPIEDTYSIEKEHWVGSGFRVKNYFPEGRNLLNRFTPFALMDYGVPFKFPPSETPRGISPHPHRGIETVTFALQGAIEHHDNVSNHGVIYPGDVQWMTAGKAIMHKEYHEKEFQKKGGIMHMVQIWISLPEKDKFVEPRYQDIIADDMGKYYLPDDKGRVAVVAGKFEDVPGPAKVFSPMNVYMVDLKHDARLTLDEPGDYNTGLLIISGDLEVNKTSCSADDFILFENKPGIIELNSRSHDVKILVLSGKPLNEPQFAAGPFIMNSKEDLRQASQDYRDGKFGSDKF